MLEISCKTTYTCIGTAAAAAAAAHLELSGNWELLFGFTRNSTHPGGHQGEDEKKEV
jgi:hypothetical protein